MADLVITAALYSPLASSVVAISSQAYGADNASQVSSRPLLLLHGQIDTSLPLLLRIRRVYLVGPRNQNIWSSFPREITASAVVEWKFIDIRNLGCCLIQDETTTGFVEVIGFRYPLYYSRHLPGLWHP